MKLSLAITTYNRAELTIKSFEKVLNDDRIGEIVIVDDCSIQENYIQLEVLLRSLDNKKIRLYRNESNIGMSLNKLKAIDLCFYDWVIIFDSDNVLDVNYLDAFEKPYRKYYGLWKGWIFCPSAALPKFDYKDLEGDLIDTLNVRRLLQSANGNKVEWLLNTCNYIVHRQTYLDNYKANPNMKATDTIWHNYNHLRNKGSFYVVPDMTYQHLVWEGCGS